LYCGGLFGQRCISQRHTQRRFDGVEDVAVGVPDLVFRQAAVAVAAEGMEGGGFGAAYFGHLLWGQGWRAVQLQQHHVIVVVGEAGGDGGAARFALATARLREVNADCRAVCLRGCWPRAA
jgi:hypothetical protein